MFHISVKKDIGDEDIFQFIIVSNLRTDSILVVLSSASLVNVGPMVLNGGKKRKFAHINMIVWLVWSRRTTHTVRTFYTIKRYTQNHINNVPFNIVLLQHDNPESCLFPI